MSKYTRTKYISYEDHEAIVRDITADLKVVLDKYTAETDPDTGVLSLMGAALNMLAREDAERDLATQRISAR